MSSSGNLPKEGSRLTAKPFDSLSTEQFRIKMRPAALLIYDTLWPNCKIDDLRENGVAVHILDKEFGVDTLATLASGQWLSIQEKYRRHKFLVSRKLQIEPPWPDFTQEFLNAAGTNHESPGEWFKLGAQLYFYGWTNQDETAFAAWVILDIPKYKLLVESSGGLDGIGKRKDNRTHGRAAFYAISLKSLMPAVLFYKGKENEIKNGGT